MSALLTAAIPAQAVAFEPKCSRSEIRDFLTTFVDAYNRGDVDYLDQIWADEEHFFWYSDDADVLRRGPLSEDRKTLPVYFSERSLFGDQLHLGKLSIRWERGWHAAWGISFKLHRTSDQPGATGAYRGKAAATCGADGQFLHAWAMGRVP